MLCGRRLVWRRSISQIFVFFLLGFIIKISIEGSLGDRSAAGEASDHSVLRASTGSFFAASPEGIRPAI